MQRECGSLIGNVIQTFLEGVFLGFLFLFEYTNQNVTIFSDQLFGIDLSDLCYKYQWSAFRIKKVIQAFVFIGKQFFFYDNHIFLPGLCYRRGKPTYRCITCGNCD